MATGGSLGAARLGVEVDPGRFQAGMKRVEASFTRTMRRMDAQKAVADIEADNKELLRKVAESKAAIASVRDHKARLLFDTDDAIKDTEEFQEKIRGLDKQIIELNTRTRLLNKEKLISQQELNRLKTYDRQLGLVDKSLKLQQKRQEELHTAHERAVVDLETMRSRYVALRSEIEQSDRSFRFFTDRVEQLRVAKLNSELDLLRKQIHQVGGNTSELDLIVDRHSGTLRRWASSLGDIRLHLGLVSLNLKQFALVAGAMANLLSGLAGGFSALIGVTGSGLAGAIGLGTSALGSFGLVGAGIIGIMKPLIADFGNARDAIKAYDDAVLKYGKGSTQAQGKMEQMERVLGSLNKSQRDAIRGAQGLSKRWQELTAGARPAFFKTAAEGIKTLNHLMPMLAKESVAAFEAASRGTEKWFKGLRSAEAENIIQTMMQNATAALGPLMDALGNLTTFIGRMSASFSRHLPGVARTFESWTQGLADGASNAQQLDDRVDTLMERLKALGNFLSSGVSLIKNFFAAGTDAGQGFLESMTATMDRWNEFLTSASGRNSVAQWMAEGVETTKAFAGALGSLGQGLAAMGPITEPFLAAFLALTNALGSFLQLVGRIPGATTAIRGLVTAFLGLRLFTGLQGAVMGMVTALTTLQAAVTTSGTVAVGGFLGTLGRFTRFIPGIGAAVGLAAGLFGDFGNSAAEAAERTQELTASVSGLDNALSGLATADADFLANRVAQARAAREVTAAEEKVQKLVAQGKEGTAAYRDATEELDLARANLIRTDEALSASIKAFTDGIKAGNKAMDDAAKVQRDLGIAEQLHGKQYKGLVSALQAYRTSMRGGKADTETFRRGIAGLGLSFDDFKKFVSLSEEDISSMIKLLRGGDQAFGKVAAKLNSAALGFQGSGKAAQQSEKKVRSLLEAYGAPVSKLLLEADDKDAARKITNVLTKAEELGKFRAALKILLDDRDADAKLKALNRLVIKPKKAKVEGDTDDAEGKLRDVEGFRINDKTFTISDGGSAARVRGAIQGVISALAGITNKTVTIFQRTVKQRAAGGPLATSSRERSTKVTRPTILTGEEGPAHPEFVIATNPAYRRANLGYLQLAAQALGVPVLGFAKGGPTKGRFRVGAVPEDRVTGRFSQAQQSFQTARDKVKTLQDKEKQRQQDIKQDGKSSIPPQTAKIAAARENMRDKEATKDKWSRRLKAVREVNKDINLFQSSIDRAGTQMDLAQAKGNKGQFRNWRSVRRKQLLKLKETLNKAAAKAGDYPQFAQELKQRIASIKLELHELPNFEREEAVTPTLEDLLTKSEAETLDKLRRQEVLASVTSDLGDDEAARKASLPFFEALFARLRSSGAPTDVLEQVASEIISRRPDTSEAGGATGPSFGEQFFTLNKERFNLFRNFASNFIPNPTTAAYNNPPSYAAGQASPAGNSVSITNNFQAPPPDPHTWTKQQDYEVRAATA